MSTEIKERFKKIRDVSHPEYNPIYAVSTFIDPKYAFTLDDEQIGIAIAEIKRMVCTRIFCALSTTVIIVLQNFWRFC
jgi:hypothetical protein